MKSSIYYEKSFDKIIQWMNDNTIDNEIINTIWLLYEYLVKYYKILKGSCRVALYYLCIEYVFDNEYIQYKCSDIIILLNIDMRAVNYCKKFISFYHPILKLLYDLDTGSNAAHDISRRPTFKDCKST